MADAPQKQETVEKVPESQGPTVVDPSKMFVPEGEGKGPFYAWSRFIGEREQDSGIVTKWIMEGDKVSQSDLGVSDEEWQDLVKSGAVREAEYPVPKGSTDSPNDHYKRQMAIAAGEEVE